MSAYKLDGFYFYATHIGIKRKKFDFGILYTTKDCNSAAVFTKNSIPGECIPIGKSRIASNVIKAIVVTSGVANVATGQAGVEDETLLMEALGEELGLNAQNIFPSSTGVIGKRLPIEKILMRMPSLNLKDNLTPDPTGFAKAICTTDKKIKISECSFSGCSIIGIVKGSGMIEPNMATMLCYIITDAKIEREELQLALQVSADRSFNMISIDTDTSTSDTALILSDKNGKAVNLEDFQQNLDNVCLDLAKAVVRDAEGATKLIEVQVCSAKSFHQAKTVAKLIVNSPLVKTAIYGCEPNWGRLLMAIGKSADTSITLEKIEIKFGDQYLFGYDRKCAAPADLEKYLQENKEIVIEVQLGIGSDRATVWGCDLSPEYVRINGEYLT